MRHRILFGVFSACFMVFTCVIALGDTNAVQGDLGTWNLRWIGRGLNTGASGKPVMPERAAWGALETARSGDLREFEKLFVLPDSSRDASRVKTKFAQMQTVGRDYLFVIANEATLQPSSPSNQALTAISVVPVVPRNAGMPTPSSEPTPFVLFMKPTESEWKVFAYSPDPKLESNLLQRASSHVARAPRPTVNNAAQAAALRRAMQISSQSNILRGYELRGASQSEVNAIRERFELENSGESVNTWEQWKARYKPFLLDPPATFDVRDGSPIDFSTPVAALKSYRRAILTGDARTLLAHADQSGRAWLKRQVGVDENSPKSTYEMFPKLSRVTVLFTATNRFDGKEYVLVFSRDQASISPKENRVAFNMDVFRYVGGKLQITDDIGIISPFRGVIAAAKADNGNLMPYPKFFEATKQSSFPPYFYTINGD